jgi:hypothetical protein
VSQNIQHLFVLAESGQEEQEEQSLTCLLKLQSLLSSSLSDPVARDIVSRYF